MRISLAIAFAVGVLSPTAHAETIRIGSISSTPVEETRIFQPLADYLSDALKAHGIEGVEIVVAKTIPEMADLLKSGKADLYIDSPFAATAVHRLSGAKPFLRRWKKGVGEYRTQIFVRADSGIDSLEKLKGNLIAFEEQASSSGYLLPKLMLRQMHFTLTQKKSISDSVVPDEIGYLFSSDDDLTVKWVLKGKVAAGACDDEGLRRRAGQDFGKLRILHESFPMPRHVVLHRADLSSERRTQVRDALLAMHETEAGRKALEAFQKTTKFDELSSTAMAPLMLPLAQSFLDSEFGLTISSK
ncbi:MAG: phosphate/phosphite/phosphonate ABC transporter substrate-binding protein [Bdellovibrionota bacterium]